MTAGYFFQTVYKGIRGMYRIKEKMEADNIKKQGLVSQLFMQGLRLCSSSR
jgi:hypothetical protein